MSNFFEGEGGYVVNFNFPQYEVITAKDHGRVLKQAGRPFYRNRPVLEMFGRADLQQIFHWLNSCLEIPRNRIKGFLS